MRTHHVIAIVAVLVGGFGTMQFFFPSVKAEAHINPSGMNVLQMQSDMDTKSLPALKMNDMTFVFDSN